LPFKFGFDFSFSIYFGGLVGSWHWHHFYLLCNTYWGMEECMRMIAVAVGLSKQARGGGGGILLRGHGRHQCFMKKMLFNDWAFDVRKKIE
jgi:hypothetical protein